MYVNDRQAYDKCAAAPCRCCSALCPILAHFAQRAAALPPLRPVVRVLRSCAGFEGRVSALSACRLVVSPCSPHSLHDRKIRRMAQATLE